MGSFTKDELQTLINQNKTVLGTARTLNINPATLRYQCQKLGVKTPTKKEAYDAISHSIPLTTEALSLLDGLIAGDSSYDWNRKSPTIITANLHFSTSFPEYAQSIHDALKNVGIPSKINAKPERKNQLNPNDKTQLIRRSTGVEVTLWTPRIKELHTQRLRWYPPPKSTKRIPLDISDTPTMWRWLYVGDGSIKRNSDASATLKISTNSFTREEIQQLVDLLMQRGINAYIGKQECDGYTYEQFALYIGPTRCAKAFLDFIGPPPIPFFDYKWRVNDQITSCIVCGNPIPLTRRTNATFCSTQYPDGCKWVKARAEAKKKYDEKRARDTYA